MQTQTMCMGGFRVLGLDTCTHTPVIAISARQLSLISRFDPIVHHFYCCMSVVAHLRLNATQKEFRVRSEFELPRTAPLSQLLVLGLALPRGLLQCRRARLPRLLPLLLRSPCLVDGALSRIEGVGLLRRRSRGGYRAPRRSPLLLPRLVATPGCRCGRRLRRRGCG